MRENTPRNVSPKLSNGDSKPAQTDKETESEEETEPVAFV